MKDGSGSYAVFTEQGSSASQMTAAKIISRLPGCEGQAADAVSAYIQVRMRDAQKLLKWLFLGIAEVVATLSIAVFVVVVMSAWWCRRVDSTLVICCHRHIGHRRLTCARRGRRSPG